MNKISSIYVDKAIYDYQIDYLFISAQPLASIVLYSNKKAQFKCFSINGSETPGLSHAKKKKKKKTKKKKKKKKKQENKTKNKQKKKYYG